MPRKSTVKTLPPEILTEVNNLLGNDLATLDEIVERLQELGHPRSRSALGRHKQNLDQVAERLRRSREMAEALVKEVGPAATEGKTGRLLVEILQNLVFDHLLNQSSDDEDGPDKDPMGSQDFFFLARAMKEMAQAQKIDVDRERVIREETARDAAERAVAVAKKVAKEKGVTLGKDALDQIRRQVGIIE